MYQKIREFLTTGNRSVWCAFALLAIAILFKIVLFHWLSFQTIIISSLWKNPLIFYVFWTPKIAISLFIASFVFISKRKWWSVIVLLLIDAWCISNMIYYRANNMFISIEAIEMVGNLNGFESSISLYWTWKLIWFVVITLLYALILPILSKPTRYSKIFVIVTSLILLLELPIGAARYEQNKRAWGVENMKETIADYMIPYMRIIKPNYNTWDTNFVIKEDWNDAAYIEEHSIVSFANFVPFIKIVRLYKNLYFKFMGNSQNLGKGAVNSNEIEKYLNSGQSAAIVPKHNLILLIVESFESWVIGLKDNKGEYVSPNFNKLVKRDGVCYFPKVKSEAKDGVSGDGQMIYNTGLLPLQRGAACMLYGDNVYPNWAHLYPVATTIIPTQLSTWNQKEITYSYGYHEAIYNSDDLFEWWSDKELIDTSTAYLQSVRDTLFCAQFITISMHTPFNGHEDNNPLVFPDDTPEPLKKYLNCVHYTDSCVGSLLNFLYTQKYDENTVLVITGDHTIFKDMMLREFQHFAQRHDWEIKDGKNYVPLIIYSPDINERVESDEEYYQMDIYPTIMHLIGCEDYFWKGFGVNLLDSVQRHQRLCTEQEAYQLSDQLIRSNWFKTYRVSM